MKQTPLDKKLKYDYICCDCARGFGGVWPEGLVATFHTETCEYCKKEKGLCNIGDWNWPDKTRGMRD